MLKKGLWLGGAAVVSLSVILLAPRDLGAQISVYGNGRPERGYLIPNVPYEKGLTINSCGPACLSMVIGYWGRPPGLDQEAIAAEIYDADRKGSMNSEMALFPRLRGFETHSLRGDLETLRGAVLKGIPVIVLTRPIKQIGKGHYRVVIGIDEGRGLVVFHDPIFGARSAMKVRSFLKIWNMGRGPNEARWMMALVRAGQGPPFPDLPGRSVTHINLATAYYRRGDYDVSISEWEKARETAGGDPVPVYSLGMVRLKQGRLDEAAACAIEALRIDGQNAYAEDVLGLAYAGQGRIAEAMGALGRALRKAPKEKFIRDHYLQVRKIYIDRAGRGQDQRQGGPK